MARARVLLPLPDSPTTATVFCLWISMLTFFSTMTVPP